LDECQTRALWIDEYSSLVTLTLSDAVAIDKQSRTLIAIPMLSAHDRHFTLMNYDLFPPDGPLAFVEI
jgi:hypothetical protein